MYDSGAFFAFAPIVIYLVMVTIVVFASYWVIRLAVFHAMKAHTRWIQKGQP
ncbi:hypothetical protein [Microbacterium sp. Root61]|uniref:hypothetical protein n=1 Tax=Microbacterium sp. Root61 TaxID=1736570 RepID=UPI000A8EFF47|nr:hypothetical protein [Microbacterium sp. Root61]